MFECLPYRIFWDLMRWFSNYVLEKSLPASFRWLEFFFHNHLESGKGREGKGFCYCCCCSKNLSHFVGFKMERTSLRFSQEGFF